MNLAAGPNSWRPFASTFNREQNNLSTNVSPLASASGTLFGNPTAASPANFFSNFKSVKFLQPTQIISTSTEYDNDVWHLVQFQENSSYYFGSPEEMDLYPVSNSSSNGTYGYDQSLNDLNVTIELVTMIVTAILLGLIILATVIGK